ncbi:hypothetical protein ACHAXR_003617, partial [Thalassiosira sp. AJA248-18]
MVSSAGPRQKRTLWHPPSSPENKSKGGSKIPKKGEHDHSNNNNSSAGSKSKGPSTTTLLTAGASSKLSSSGTQNEKKRPKKRDGGNDSISSLGSESRDLSSVGGGGKGGKSNHKSKKGNKSRRFNEDETPGGNHAPNNNSGGTKDNRNHLRQKRGLHHGHSSKSSFSSIGSSNNNNPHHSSGGGGRNKKKNRSQPSSSPSIHLGGLIGKNGARALHELCSKYRWEMPKYNLVESSSGLENAAADTDGNGNNDISFDMTVHVNGVELGRGRGGTKNSSKQDASRKALAALVPGVVFDPNGILLDVGSELLLRGPNGEGGAEGNRRHGGSKSLSLDELGPHLASQLAIGGNANAGGGVRSRPLSPDHSEDSSISTAISEDVAYGGPLISGGPLSQKLGLQQPSPAGSGTGRLLSSNIYPCASTTSGVSSASDIDDEDENAYYSSRGASVCSTLLHAMWQIDDRIREPPSYAFDLCPSPVNAAGHIISGDTPAACSKRKKDESPREVTVHRMFQCAASLNLYFPKHFVDDKDFSSIMDYWESPLDYLQSKECSPSACGSRKRKDSFASQSTPSPIRPLPNDNGVDEQAESSTAPKKQEKEEFIQHKLESIGTGSTKRESKHKASAKLLATLFPVCKSIIEVKAEAEAARELYAANKNKAASQTKRAKLAVSSPERKSKNDISLHALSLSETREGSNGIKWSDSTTVELALERHTSIENEVDTTLQSLQELDEEGRWSVRDLSSHDIGKIVLRRMELADTDNACALLNKNERASTILSRKKRFSALSEPADPEIGLHISESDNAEENDVEEEGKGNAREDNQQELKLKLGDDSILLVLSRAVALHDPPLGCAILTLK